MSKFRNEQNVRYMRGLFFETSTDRSTVVYTLKDQDHEGYPSLYRLYMACDDPTEYTFATTYLDGWDHWERLAKAPWFREYIDRWRKELHLRVRAEALRRLRQEAAEAENKNAFSANRFLLDGNWHNHEPGAKASRRGRPSHDEIKKAADQIAEDAHRIQSDFDRILGNA